MNGYCTTTAEILSESAPRVGMGVGTNGVGMGVGINGPGWLVTMPIRAPERKMRGRGENAIKMVSIELLQLHASALAWATYGNFCCQNRSHIPAIQAHYMVVYHGYHFHNMQFDLSNIS